MDMNVQVRPMQTSLERGEGPHEYVGPISIHEYVLDVKMGIGLSIRFILYKLALREVTDHMDMSM